LKVAVPSFSDRDKITSHASFPRFCVHLDGLMVRSMSLGHPMIAMIFDRPKKLRESTN
jgi:hypothetical protein